MLFGSSGNTRSIVLDAEWAKFLGDLGLAFTVVMTARFFGEECTVY